MTSRRLVLSRSAALIGAASTGLLVPSLARAQSGKIRVGLMLPYTGTFAQLGVAIVVARTRLSLLGTLAAALVIGVMTLIGRIIFLASNRGETAPTASPAAPALMPEAALALPSGHDVKSVAMSGNRLLVHHVGPTGDGIIILDLATGAMISRVTVRRTP